MEKPDLISYVKTSGQKGLHLCVPLNGSTSFRQTREWSRRLAQILEILHPDQVDFADVEEERSGRVFIDWSQNIDFKSTVCVYSLRATESPSVSTPLAWRELKHAARLSQIGPEEVIRRVRRYGDLFEPVRLKVQVLPPLSALEIPRLRLKSA